jgi:hypothetical protein
VEPVEHKGPRLKSIVGVSRALIATVGVNDAVSILIAQFGWDVAFHALARLDSADAGAALWRAVEELACDDLRS